MEGGQYTGSNQFGGNPSAGNYQQPMPQNTPPGRPESFYGQQDGLPGQAAPTQTAPQPGGTNIPPPPNPTSDEMAMASSSGLATMTKAGLGMSIIALFLIILAIILYFAFGLYNRGTEEQIKNVINSATDTDANFQNLTVQDDTTLGTRSTDTVTVHAQVASSLVPNTDKSANLGSSTNRWNTIFTDEIQFDNGTSIITTTDELLYMDADLSYRRKMSTINAQGLSSSTGTQTLTVAESGYMFVIEEDTSSQYGFEVVLPEATGSGVFYDFVSGTSLATDGTDSFHVNCADNGATFIGGLQVNSLLDVPDQVGAVDRSVAFQSEFQGSNVLTFNNSVPVPGSLGDPGVLRGSNFRITDYNANLWLIEGNLIVNPGVTVTSMANPFGT
jgi:hypothetical protein